MLQVNLARARIETPPLAPHIPSSRISIATTAGHTNRNEDASFAARLNGDSVLVAAVADGSGGSGGGREAAQMAVMILRRRVESSATSLLMDRGFWSMLFLEIDRRLDRKASAGHTTLTAIVTCGRRLITTSVGDSRAYRWTSARTTAQCAVLNEGARPSGLLGTDRVHVSHFETAVRPGDKLLLATDGLWKYLPHGMLMRWFSLQRTSDLLPHLLAQLADRYSGRIPDDATGIAIGL